MLARTHALTGAAAWLAAAPLITTDPVHIILGTGMAAGAALAPDLDHSSGTATHAWGPVTRAIGYLIGRLTGGHRAGTHALLAIPTAALITWAALDVAGSWPAGIVVALCAALAFIACEDVIPGRWERIWPFNLGWSAFAGWAAVRSDLDLSWLPWAVAVGWAAHIAGDVVTTSGCPLWLPFTRHRVNLTRARTGGSWESVTAWVLTVAIGAIGSATIIAAPDPWVTVWQPDTETVPVSEPTGR